MTKRNVALSVLSFGLCALAVACNNDDSGSGISGLDASKSGGAFAVVSDNYSGATTISLLKEDGTVEKNEWVGSKTANPDLRSPLSNDVVLPTTSFSPKYLTTIERSLGVVTRFDLEDGHVLGQLRTDDSPDDSADDMSAYHSNPQDVFYVSEQSGWISRWAPNHDPSADEREQGTDLIEFKPATMKRLTRRIDLSSLNTMIEEDMFDKDGKPAGKVMSVAYARPAALVPAGNFLVVGIVRATDGYNYADGMTAIVDPKAGELSDMVALDGLRNCGDVRPVPGSDSHVLVGCIDAYGSTGSGAGIVEIAVDGSGKGKIVESFKVSEHDGAASTASNLVSLGKHIAIAVANGTLDPATKEVTEVDTAYRIDLESGEQTELWKSAGAFSLGVAAFDAKTGVLLIPDAGGTDAPVYGVQRFTVDAKGKVERDDFVKVAPKTTLAARYAYQL